MIGNHIVSTYQRIISTVNSSIFNKLDALQSNDIQKLMALDLTRQV